MVPYELKRYEFGGLSSFARNFGSRESVTEFWSKVESIHFQTSARWDLDADQATDNDELVETTRMSIAMKVGGAASKLASSGSPGSTKIRSVGRKLADGGLVRFSTMLLTDNLQRYHQSGQTSDCTSRRRDLHTSWAASGWRCKLSVSLSRLAGGLIMRASGQIFITKF